MAYTIISYVFGVFVPHLVLTFYVYIIIIYLTHTHTQFFYNVFLNISRKLYIICITLFRSLFLSITHLLQEEYENTSIALSIALSHFQHTYIDNFHYHTHTAAATLSYFKLDLKIMLLCVRVRDNSSSSCVYVCAAYKNRHSVDLYISHSRSRVLWVCV